MGEDKMLNYKENNGKIEELTIKCIKGTNLICKSGTDLNRRPKSDGKENWIYSLRFQDQQIGMIQFYPLNYEIKINIFSDLPLTLGEEYKKQLKHDLQTLVNIEFNGTSCNNQ